MPCPCFLPQALRCWSSRSTCLSLCPLCGPRTPTAYGFQPAPDPLLLDRGLPTMPLFSEAFLAPAGSFWEAPCPCPVLCVAVGRDETPPPRPGLRLGAPPGLGGLVTSMPLPSPAENSAPCLAEWTCGEGGDCQGPLLRFWQVGAELPRPRCGGDGIDSQTESLGSNPSSATMARHLTSQFPALASVGLTGAPTAQVVDTLGGHMGWRVGSLLI